MKIAICVNSFFPSIGGCEIVCNNIINALYKNHEVFVFTQHDPKRKLSNFPYKIIEFRGQSDSLLFINKIKEINPALYIFDASWLWNNIDKLKNENASGEYYLTDLIRFAREQGERVEAIPVSNIIEGLQPNSKAELEALERLISK